MLITVRDANTKVEVPDSDAATQYLCLQIALKQRAGRESAIAASNREVVCVNGNPFEVFIDFDAYFEYVRSREVGEPGGEKGAAQDRGAIESIFARLREKISRLFKFVPSPGTCPMFTVEDVCAAINEVEKETKA